MRPTMRSANPFLSLAPDQLQIHILQSGACLCNELDAPPSSADCVHNVRIFLFWITHSRISLLPSTTSKSPVPTFFAADKIASLTLSSWITVLLPLNRPLEFGRGTQSHQFGVQDRDPVADPLRFVEVVRVQEDGLLFLLQIEDEFPDRL